MIEERWYLDEHTRLILTNGSLILDGLLESATIHHLLHDNVAIDITDDLILLNDVCVDEVAHDGNFTKDAFLHIDARLAHFEGLLLPSQGVLGLVDL
jgi:hypothetical protein